MKKCCYIIRVFKECYIATITAIIFISDDRRYYSVYVAVWSMRWEKKKGRHKRLILALPNWFSFSAHGDRSYS